MMKTILVFLLIVSSHGLSIMRGRASSMRSSLRRTNEMLRSRLHAATLSFQQIKKLDLALRLQDETLLKSIAGKLDVPPPLNAPKIVWSWCWKIQCLFLPLLHAVDKYVPQDTCLNLAVLWWKAIAGDRVAFDLLPSFTRSVVRWPFRLIFPRLHHQNVALRTKFLTRLCAKR